MKLNLKEIKPVIQNGFTNEFRRLFNRTIMVTITGIGNSSFVNIHAFSFKSDKTDIMKDYLKDVVELLHNTCAMKKKELLSAAYDEMGFSVFYQISKEKLMELYVMFKMKYPLSTDLT